MKKHKTVIFGTVKLKAVQLQTMNLFWITLMKMTTMQFSNVPMLTIRRYMKQIIR